MLMVLTRVMFINPINQNHRRLSQVLPSDYVRERDIEIVLSEMAEQVAIRMRREHPESYYCFHLCDLL